MLIWNSNHELDQASFSNFKAQGLKIEKRNCSKLSIISDDPQSRQFFLFDRLDKELLYKLIALKIREK